MVATKLYENSLSVKRLMMLVFPTPVSPIIISLHCQSARGFAAIAVLVEATRCFTQILTAETAMAILAVGCRHVPTVCYSNKQQASFKCNTFDILSYYVYPAPCCKPFCQKQLQVRGIRLKFDQIQWCLSTLFNEKLR